MKKRLVIFIIIICMAFLSSCFDYFEYPRYKLKDIENKQYSLTAPDGRVYVTYEDNIWYPSSTFYIERHTYESIGKSSAGYIYETTSEICLFQSGYHERNEYTFFLESIELPMVSIENINNAVLELIDEEEKQKVLDKEITEVFINLYNDTEAYETKDKNTMKKEFYLTMECELYRGLYFLRAIYWDTTGYYMYIDSEYDSSKKETVYYFCDCTSVIERILENNHDYKMNNDG